MTHDSFFSLREKSGCRLTQSEQPFGTAPMADRNGLQTYELGAEEGKAVEQPSLRGPLRIPRFQQPDIHRVHRAAYAESVGAVKALTADNTDSRARQ
jgi:hypothetical protein